MKRRSLVALVAVAAVFVMGAATALAYWTTGGFGAGSGTTGTLQPVTVVAFTGGDTPATTLLPGGPNADVILRVNNANSFSVTLVSVEGTGGAITPDAAHSDCSPTGVTFADQTTLSIPVPPGSSLVHLPAAASMDATSANACQGATFLIPVGVTVRGG